GDYEVVATRWEEAEKLVAEYPGRFVSTAVMSPGLGMADVREVRAHLADEWVVGLWLHTHSWDRRFDHADLYPYYAVASELDVPATMQAGPSGDLFPCERVHRIGIDRAAIGCLDTRLEV